MQNLLPHFQVIRAKYWAEGPASRSNGNGTSQKGEWRESILLLSGTTFCIWRGFVSALSLFHFPMGTG